MSRKKKDGQFCSFFLDKKTANSLSGMSKITKQSKTTIVEQCVKKEAAKYENENGDIASIPAIYCPNTGDDSKVPCQILRKLTVNGIPCYRILTPEKSVRVVPKNLVSIITAGDDKDREPTDKQ